MKNILKKNQVIITALVIMIAVAGYLNFTQDKVNDMVDVNGDSKEASASADTDKKVKDENGKEKKTTEEKGKDTGETEKEGTDVADVVLDEDGNEVVENTDPDGTLYDLSAEDLGKDSTGTDAEDTVTTASEDSDNPGEAVLVSNNIGSDFFSSAKLTREQTRAKNKEMLMELVNNTNITEEQKQEAIDNVINMTTISEKESASEVLLEAKGFDDAVVSIVDNGVDVIINADNLTEQQMAQVEDIVKRKTGIAIENMVITPVGVEEATKTE